MGAMMVMVLVQYIYLSRRVTDVVFGGGELLEVRVENSPGKTPFDGPVDYCRFVFVSLISLSLLSCVCLLCVLLERPTINCIFIYCCRRRLSLRKRKNKISVGN